MPCFCLLQAEYLDFTVGMMSNDVVSLVNRALPPLDVTLFLRPFTPTSWALIIVATLVLVSTLLFVSKLWTDYRKRNPVPAEEDWTSQRIVIISGKISLAVGHRNILFTFCGQTDYAILYQGLSKCKMLPFSLAIFHFGQCFLWRCTDHVFQLSSNSTLFDC